MSNIVHARKCLTIVIENMEAEGSVHQIYVEALKDIQKMMTRESSKRKRAKSKSTPITDEIIKAVRRKYEKDPNASQLEIANLFNINPGRVSEIINSKRT